MPPPPIPKAAIEAAQKKRSSITPQSAPLSVPAPPVPPESHAENCAAGTEQQGEAKGCQDCPNKVRIAVVIGVGYGARGKALGGIKEL